MTTWRVQWHYDNHPRTADCADQATADQLAKALEAKGHKVVVYGTEGTE